MKNTIYYLLLTTLTFWSFAACNTKHKGADKHAHCNSETASITRQEVINAQNAWGDGIVRIGKVYLKGGDYQAEAAKHIKTFYNYGNELVLFKPTLASEKQFRTDFEGALSYFTGGNTNYPEDHGFAIKPWSRVRWESIGIRITGNTALAMGNYYFTPQAGGEEVKVEYSFAYTKTVDGALKIVLHGSHLPYIPSK